MLCGPVSDYRFDERLLVSAPVNIHPRRDGYGIRRDIAQYRLLLYLLG